MPKGINSRKEYKSQIFQLYPKGGGNQDLVIRDFWKTIPLQTDLHAYVKDQISQSSIGSNKFDLHSLVDRDTLIKELWLVVKVKNPHGG